MLEIITQKLNTSWLDEKLKIVEQIQDWTSANLAQFSIDKMKEKKILDTIKNKNFTISELSKLISDIKTEEIREEFDSYLEIIIYYEKKIIKYLISKWLLDNNKFDQEIKFNFKWTKFKWMDENLLIFLERYNLNKWVFFNELDEVKDEDAEYIFTIFIWKEKKEFYIKDMQISEKKK